MEPLHSKIYCKGIQKNISNDAEEIHGEQVDQETTLPANLLQQQLVTHSGKTPATANTPAQPPSTTSQNSSQEGTTVKATTPHDDKPGSKSEQPLPNPKNSPVKQVIPGLTMSKKQEKKIKLNKKDAGKNQSDLDDFEWGNC